MRLATFGLVSALLAAYVWLTLDVRTAITDFLPRDERASRLELARALTESHQARAVVFTLSATEPAAHRSAAKTFAEELAQSGHFRWLRGGLDRADQAAFHALFFPARLGLLTLPEGSGPVSDAYLRERARALRQRLASPLGMLETRLAPEDPLGAFQELLATFGKERGTLTLEDGQLVTEDGRFSVLFGETRARAFDTTAQASVVRVVDEAFARAKAREPSLTLEWTGVNRYALEGEASVKGDIERISTLSMIGIFLLYLLIFRSLREPLVVLLPIGFGCLLAVAVCQLAFGFVHGLSLAFGSSIIGVAEDFSTHYFAHRRAAPAEESNDALMRRLWRGMWLGALTTVVGILALTASGFPGLVQMALFGAVGVVGALIATRWAVPPLSRAAPLPPTKLLGPLGLGLVRWLARRPARALWFIVPCLLCALVGGTRLRVADGVRSLRTPTAALDAESERVQARLGQRAKGRAVVATGADDEAALTRAEQAVALLREAQHAGELEAFRSVTDVLPSVRTQHATRGRLVDDPTLGSRVSAALLAEGMRPEAFQPFLAELARRDAPVVTPSALLASPFADLVSPFRLELPEGVAYLVPVTTARSEALEARFRGRDGLVYLDQEALFDAAFERFRGRAIGLFGVGLVLVLITLLARYRSLRAALLGMLPAVLAAGATLGVEGLLGMEISLMHGIAILLVVSMGVDYGIYVLESRESLTEGVTTLGSIVLAALTTVLSFGTLGLSSNPALSGIGITVSLGLLFSVLASPVVIALASQKESS